MKQLIVILFLLPTSLLSQSTVVFYQGESSNNSVRIKSRLQITTSYVDESISSFFIENSTSEISDTDGDGVSDERDLCNDTPLGAMVNTFRTDFRGRL